MAQAAGGALLRGNLSAAMSDAENGVAGGPHAAPATQALVSLPLPPAQHLAAPGVALGVPVALAPGEAPADALGAGVDIVASLTTIPGAGSAAAAAAARGRGRHYLSSGGGASEAADGADGEAGAAEGEGPCDLPAPVRRTLRSYLGRHAMKSVRTWKDLSRVVAEQGGPAAGAASGGHWLVGTLLVCVVLVGAFLFMAGQYDYVAYLAQRDGAGPGEPFVADGPITGPAALGAWLLFWRKNASRTFSFEFLNTWGGRFAPKLDEGQWWRWVTSLLLHQSSMHLVSNLALFLVLSCYLESLYSVLRVLPIWLVAGVAGNMISAFFDAPCTIVVGASGTVFGLLGMFLADAALNFESIRLLWLRMLGMAACVALMVTLQLTDKKLAQVGSVSQASHIGGFLAGLAASLLLLPDFKARRAAKVQQLLQAAGLGEHLPDKGSRPGRQLYSFWQRRRYVRYALYALSAVFLLLALVALPIYLYIRVLPHAKCEHVLAAATG